MEVRSCNDDESDASIVTRASDGVCDDDEGSSSGSPTIHHPSAMIAGSQVGGCSGCCEVSEDPELRQSDRPTEAGEDGDGYCDLPVSDDKENVLRDLRPADSSQLVKNEGSVEQQQQHQTIGIARMNADAPSGTRRDNHRYRFTSITGTTSIEKEKGRVMGGAVSRSSMDSVFLADANLLHQRGFFEGMKKGYWVSPECVFPCRPGDCIVADDPGGRSNATIRGWCHGQILLQATLPTSEQGWVNLPPTEIPSGPPLTEPVHSWMEYSKARNLAATSLAPLLLTNAMTVHHMLCNILHLPDRAPVNAETGRHSGYLVYVLGAERELNHLPIFEELASLIRGMDLELRVRFPGGQTPHGQGQEVFPFVAPNDIGGLRRGQGRCGWQSTPYFLRTGRRPVSRDGGSGGVLLRPPGRCCCGAERGDRAGRRRLGENDSGPALESDPLLLFQWDQTRPKDGEGHFDPKDDGIALPTKT
jgi:hypothetical protein